MALACALAAELPDDPSPEEIFRGGKKEDTAALNEKIEARQVATQDYLKERLDSAVEAIKGRQAPSDNAIPAEIWRACKGFYVFDQWQAGHLITTEVCAGVGAARVGENWSAAVFYRAFDLGRGLKAGTRQARHIFLFAMSDKARAWMDLSHLDLAQQVKDGAKIALGPMKEVPPGFDPLSADIWVYDDSAVELEDPAQYPVIGTILDNPWTTKELYNFSRLIDTKGVLRSSGIRPPPLVAELRELLIKQLQ